MLSDYLNTAPALIAIINSVIAVGSSHFKPEQARWKYALLATSIILGFAAATATVVGQRQVLVVQAARAKKLTEEREQIGAFIEAGDDLQLFVGSQNMIVPRPDLAQWNEHVEAWLAAELGESYVRRFRDPSRTPHGEPEGLDDAHLRYWIEMSERLERLQQFSAELSPARFQ